VLRHAKEPEATPVTIVAGGGCQAPVPASERHGLPLKGTLMYSYIGSMKAKPGHRDEVTAILLSGAATLRESGCVLYVVSESDSDDDLIWVSEVWQSKEHHDASLRLPETKEAIAKAMPMLTGEFTSQEGSVVGGLGV
jgi:quinol monooxygenase YgiN